MKVHYSSSREVVLFRADERKDGHSRLRLVFLNSFMNALQEFLHVTGFIPSLIRAIYHLCCKFHIALLRQECHNSKFGIFELLV